MGSPSRAHRRCVVSRLLPVLVLGALPAIASAQTPTRYGELRQQYPAIDEVVASLPSSDLHASFNHLSMLLNRRDIADASDGAGALGELSPQWSSAMASALDGLAAEIEQDGWRLAPEQSWVLLQLVSAYAFERNLELFGGTPHEPCLDPSLGHPCFSLPIELELRRLVTLLAPTFDEVAAWYDDVRGSLPPYEGAGGSGLTVPGFPDRVIELGLFITPTGIESIDY